MKHDNMNQILKTMKISLTILSLPLGKEQPFQDPPNLQGIAQKQWVSCKRTPKRTRLVTL